MKDPIRIQRILNKLGAAWAAKPDMRLGQLYFCVGRPLFTMDPYFVEDEQFEKVLDLYLKENNLSNGWKS